ncbi:membrane-bound PQQ-dependent dehydrogenase, glucose/quinate/shikimate family [Pseudomonas putida]|uniref:membrane-bound PQQ-dependent dehydrogenase, glucose/quinate/shikimate family n=1 Tax=Pseudomonas putida TaxID=303 RepID=UPI003905EB5A
MILRITGTVVALLGLATLFMGGQLVMVGGSPAYALIAVGLLVTAILLFLKKRAALTFYAALMWAVLIWIIAEVGFDKWQWIPRGNLFALVGLWLALPWVTRALHGEERKSFHPLLGGTVAVMLLLVVGIMFYDPYPQAGTLSNPVSQQKDDAPQQDWAAYGGTNEGQRFSKLDQVNAGNVKNLSVAWEYHTGDRRDSAKDASEYTFEATPLKVNNRLYVCTAHNEVHALDPVTGVPVWKYAPEKDRSYLQQHQTCRGVSYFSKAEAATDDAAPAAKCDKRILMATASSKLVALDADTGKLCEDFGNAGIVDLNANMGKIRPHALMQTAAPLVAGGLVIVGGSVMDNGYHSGNPSGVIRAYDAVTGKLAWNFDPARPQDTLPIDQAGQYAQDTPIAWGTLSADIKNQLVFVPFGNASPDELGLQRDPDSNVEKFRDTLVALDLRSGALKWKYQTSNNDLWDRDNPSQPTLLDLGSKGQEQPAILLPTKVGNIFVLNRLTGEPIVPVDQVAVSDKGGVPGERFAKTQPVSHLNFIPEPLKESSMWGLTPFDQMSCRIAFNQLNYTSNPWTPSSEQGSIIFPGNIGTFNWGSIAVDPERQIAIAAPVRLAYKYTLIKRTPETKGKRLFTEEGTPYWNENFDGAYAIHIQQFASGLGIPCIAPPWGRMVGVDLNTGKTEWMRRIGTSKNLKTSFLPGRFPVGFPLGMVAHGGPLITAGGLVFHGATADNFIRAYDINTGEMLWQFELPAGGQATPSTYIGEDGKQYIVISAGGHGSLGTTLGDSVIAFRID